MTSPIYYPIQKRWRRLRPLFERPDILRVSHEDMESYSAQRAEDNGYPFRPRPFTLDARPADHDSCDWRFNRGKPGPAPAFHDWACHAACHWVVTTNLIVITELDPGRPWQIATSDLHSTVVDLERQLIFDTNWLALGIAADVCWREAVEHHTSELLPVGVCLHPPKAEAVA